MPVDTSGVQTMVDVSAIMSQPMTIYTGIFCAGLLSFGVLSVVRIIHHARLARTIGLPFVILPFSLLGAPWQLAQFIVVPALKTLPKRLTQDWLPLLLLNEFWHNGYEPFERLKADTFLAVSPGGIILFTCDPDVNVQLFRDGAFGKPAELMSILNVYGPTITGTDGLESRLYRKITAPFFTENTLRRVFTQSVSGARVFLNALLHPNAHRQLRTLSARLSLNTLCQLIFTYQTDCDLVQALAFQDNVPDTQTLSFSQALHGLTENLGAIFAVPHWLLRLSPFRAHNHVFACYSELGSYMNQVKQAREATLSERSDHKTYSSEDLLDLLVQAGSVSEDQASPVLTNAQVIGQIFLFMFAGHEANANVLVSIILLLACHPVVQKMMQRDLDRLLRDTGSETWSYDKNYSALMQSTVGAVINEALRLFTVIPILPKHVPSEGPWLPIIVKGQRHLLPPSTIALVNTSAIHRHPKYWPKRRQCEDEYKYTSWSDIRSDPRQRPYAVVDFDPSRWLDVKGTAQVESSSFLRPQAGTFIPFSEGSRGCLGRRFALVEVCAVVATLFKTHSVELLRELGESSDEEAWLQARRSAALALSEGTRFDTSLRVVKNVPIRFVRRNTST